MSVDTFGERLRFIRLLEGLTQRDLAEAVEVSHTYISKLENGKDSPPSDETIERMERACRMEPGQLAFYARRAPRTLNDTLAHAPVAASRLVYELASWQLPEALYEEMLAVIQRHLDAIKAPDDLAKRGSRLWAAATQGEGTE